MKKRIISLMLAMAMTASLVACGAKSDDAAATKEETTEASADAENKEVPETTEIHWARANSGNIFVTLAQQNGYFEEYGLKVVEDPVDSSKAAMTALSTEQVDVTSNQGTNMPLQNIASGNDFTIIGGYMLKGMYLVAKKGTGWNGIEDLKGKRIAGLANDTAYTGALLKAGIDPLTEVEWIECETNSDRLAAVISGKADYANCSGDLLYQVGQNDEVEIVQYLGDITPNYGCCRMNVRTDWLKENPTTAKLMLKALIRAQQYFEANKEECAEILAKEIDAEPEFVKAYLLNPNYVISVDPVKNAVVNNWNVLLETGFLDDAAKDMDVTEHIDEKLYKEALDEVIEEHGDEDPDFYNERLKFYEEMNL